MEVWSVQGEGEVREERRSPPLMRGGARRAGEDTLCAVCSSRSGVARACVALCVRGLSSAHRGRLALLRADGAERLAVVSLDAGNVGADRAHRCLHLIHLLEEDCHEAARAARLLPRRRAHLDVAGAATTLQLVQSVCEQRCGER